MREGGWFKIYRSMFDNPTVMKDAGHLALWVYLLGHATHKPHETYFGGKKTILQPGQLITGTQKLADALNLGRGKVRNILKDLKTDHQINQQATRYGSLITIVNWSEYQEVDHLQNQRQANDEPTTSQRRTTIQECKKERMEECKNTLSPIPPPSVKPVRNVIPPTMEMVSAYADERAKSGRISVDVDEFYDFYTSNGWKIGKNPMKDWQAAFRTWEKKREQDKKTAQSRPRNEVLAMLQRGDFDE